MQEIAPNVFVETTYPGVNVAAIVSPEGLLCVDAPSRPADLQDWIARLHSRFEAPVRYLVLTDHHIDRLVGAHAFYARVIAHEAAQARISAYGSRFPVPLVESMGARYDLMRKDFNGFPVIPPQISFCSRATVHLGDIEVNLWHMPSATKGSLWLYIKEKGVLFTGDTLVVGQHPPLLEARSKAWLEALVHLRRERVKADVIVPGRGPISDKSATEPLSFYLRRVRRRVQSLYKAGRPRADTTALIGEFIDMLPDGGAPRDWLQRQLKAGLDHIYDEFKAVDSPRAPRSA